MLAICLKLGLHCCDKRHGKAAWRGKGWFILQLERRSVIKSTDCPCREPAPTWWLATVHNSSSRHRKPSTGPKHVYSSYTYMHTKRPYM